jgi:uroporphyrinogen decarboxylase
MTEDMKPEITSKERVIKAIRFESPDRVPSHLPEPYPTDIVWIFPHGRNIKTEIRGTQQYRLSEWGSWWHVVSEQNMGEVVEPAVKDWADFDRYCFPEVNTPDRYDHVAEIINQNHDKYIMGVLSASLFPHYWEIRGLMNFFTDMYDEIENMETLLDRIVEIQMKSVDIWSQHQIDGIVVGFDDWGLQDRLMIDPVFFRTHFLPRYRKVWQHIHSRGFDVILHSCGEITSILPDLIEAGLNVINMDQQENMGLEKLGREFGGRICFWNPVDIQTVMIQGTPMDVDQYALKMILALGSPQGGFIGKYYPQPEGAGQSEANRKAESEAFIRYRDIFMK